jgi:predicted  nucleic acid-binding Zn-ribbon protein
VSALRLQTPAQLFQSLDEISQILGNEARTQEMLKELRNDLSVSKRAYSSVDGELLALRERSKALEKERNDLLNKLKVRQVQILSTEWFRTKTPRRQTDLLS